jgi:hypothetical protein
LLDWDGVCNARDLGGLRLTGGETIRSGALVRADNLARLTPDGWRSLHRFGIGTIVDLRDPAVERSTYRNEAGPVEIVRVPVIDLSDEAFWSSMRGEQDAGRFYRAALERWPGAFARAVCAIARARPGGVVVHCQAGKDEALDSLDLSAYLANGGFTSGDASALRDRLLQPGPGANRP